MNDYMKELKWIKKHYGETLMHICRTHFAQILEQPGVLKNILKDFIYQNSRTLGNDLINEDQVYDFVDAIYYRYTNPEEKTLETDKTPYELLKEKGYTLHECTSEEEIQSYRKYYAPNEVICTINNGERLDTSYVFFAVKDNLDDIKRALPGKEQREDEYSTSVLSIQFPKCEDTYPVIISRYNHTVTNPNNTYAGNLERIAPGLTYSFKKLLSDRDMELTSVNTELSLKNYVVFDKIYKYNFEEDGDYYCPGNIVVSAKGLVKLPPSSMLVENFVIDFKNKTIKPFNDKNESAHAFTTFFLNNHIEDMRVTKRKDGKNEILVYLKDKEKPVEIIAKDNRIYGYKNEYLTSMKDKFLSRASELSEIYVPNVKKIGRFCLTSSTDVKNIDIDNVVSIGCSFLPRAKTITSIKAKKLEKVGDNVFTNAQIEHVVFPKLKKVGHGFMCYNEKCVDAYLPKLSFAETCTFGCATRIKYIYVPRLYKVENCVLEFAYELEEFHAPLLESAGPALLRHACNLKVLDCPSLAVYGSQCFEDSNSLEYFNIPTIICEDEYIDTYKDNKILYRRILDNTKKSNRK